MTHAPGRDSSSPPGSHCKEVSGIQQSQGTTYADIGEVRTVTGATTCNQLLADGCVLLGVYPLTRVADMTEAGEGKSRTRNGRCGAWWAMSLEGGTSNAMSQKGSFLIQIST
jgi:hypothetical protein